MLSRGSVPLMTANRTRSRRRVLAILSNAASCEIGVCVAERLGAWSAGDDDGIEWWLQDGALHRQDLELNTDVILASGLTGLVVLSDAGETHIRLQAGTGDEARSVELAWIQ